MQNIKQINNEDLSQLRYLKVVGLSDSMKEIATKFGHVAVYENGNVLADSSIFDNTEDTEAFINVYSAIQNCTNESRITFFTSESSVVYNAHEKQLTLLKDVDDGLAVYGESKGEVEELFYKFINHAVNKRATDIHMVMTADQTALIYYRVDGEIVLTPLSRSRAECESLIGSCFEWSGAGNAAKKNYSQDVDNDTSLDGIPVKLDGIKKEVEVRVHFRSLTKTDKVCAFRILNVGSEILTLETLGLSDVECSVLKNGVKMANGLFLICGPTGSGKSTMMVSVMNEKSKYKVMHTLEDPIETKCPDKLTFQGKASDSPEEDISGLMRTDLDIGVVSEMRTVEQLRTAMGIARTGHLVLSTLHANDAISLVERLQDMGVDRSILAEKSLLRILTAQRLVPKMCSCCKLSIDSRDMAEWKVISSKESYKKLEEHQKTIFKRNEIGCSECDYSGTKGLKLIFEFIVVDQSGRQFIRSGDSIGWLEYLKSNGWKSMADKAWISIIRGIIDPDTAEGLVPDVLIDSSKPYVYAEE